MRNRLLLPALLALLACAVTPAPAPAAPAPLPAIRNVDSRAAPVLATTTVREHAVIDSTVSIEANAVKLRELDPVLKGTVADGVLTFDCPFPACNRSHKVRVSISNAPFHERPARDTSEMVNKKGVVKVWQASGRFPSTLTVQPSIDIIEADEQGNKIRTLCWHGFVTNGEVT